MFPHPEHAVLRNSDRPAQNEKLKESQRIDSLKHEMLRNNTTIPK